MGIQITDNKFQEISQDSRMLVKTFKLEMSQHGTSTVICPICKKSPKIIATSIERTIIECECKYIIDLEIY